MEKINNASESLFTSAMSNKTIMGDIRDEKERLSRIRNFVCCKYQYYSSGVLRKGM